ncbi:cytoplasmic dynein 2 intermediate chain 1-like [Saccostrea echinata]|uniref:cytoplasmic dynein 2 intermediate chain 1-like n=1 Tax=Saccostrea echinata TaxID=191078 RepID=UPI002A81E0BA|nr:cytoplasmic dynein 2 intermediate chain 1-like [Saccostrea echinata]
MPSEKVRSKEDTWTTNELKKALNKDEIRKERERLKRERREGKGEDINEYEEKERRHRRDGEERRHHRDDEDRKKHRESKREELTEDEREAQRRERRERKEGKSSKSDDKRRDEDRRRHRDEEEEDRRERRHRDRDEKRPRDDRNREEERERRRREKEAEREKRHRDKDDRHREKEEKDDRRRRHEEDDDKRRRHRDEDGEDRRRRHRDEDGEDRRRQRDEDGEDRRRRHRDEDDDGKRRRHRDEDGEERRRRHKDEDEEDRRRKHRKDDGDEDRKRRHHRDEDEREKRRERHREDEDGYKREKHRQREKRGERTLDEDERERQRQERREKREAKEGGKSRHREEDEEERRRRKEKEREKEREREKEKEREREKRKSAKPSRKRENEPEEEENGYGDYEDDFEDYEDDFEEEEDDTPVVKGKQLSDYDLQKTPRKGGAGLDYSDSEMDEVLRALDQENERLYQDSRQGNDSPRYNQYNKQYDDQDSDSEPARPVTRGLINFTGARQRAISRKANSKTAKRAQDLLQMIELDVSSYDLFDLPPVKEYDLYIRSFGRTDTKQAYVQTNDDNIDREIQTEEIDVRQKWTQHLAEDFTGCGRGDGEKDLDEEETAQQNKQQDLGRLNSFIQKAGQVISILLDEEKDQQRQEKAENRTNLSLSEGYSQLTCLSILKGRCVEFAHFSPTQPNYLLTAYSKCAEASESNPVDRKGIICVWNTNEPSYPQRILACESQPVCCCFSPYKTTLVFAGMVDGSVCAWDLREPPALHKSIKYENSDHLLRYPTYNTAGINEVKNHQSPVTTLSPVVSYTDSDSDTHDSHEDSSGGLSFQLVSCEELGVLKFWVVAEISSPDMAGSEFDLGLSPGGRIKLVLSSSIQLQNPLREKSEPLRSFELQLSPGDLNHFYVGTEKGFVYHGLRFGSRAYPRTFTALNDAPVDIKTIDFSPFSHPCFLVTTGDGDVHLFSTKTDTALVSWPSRVWGTMGVKCARWSQSRPCVFYVLDDNSRLYTFDLLEGDSMPAKIETLSNDARVTCLSFTSDVRQAGHGGRNPQMLICLESGVNHIHTIAKDYREQQTLEDEFLPSYLARF